MKLYQAQYKIDCFPETLPTFLANEAELVYKSGNLSEYQTNVDDLAVKRYQYDSHKEELVISVQLNQQGLSIVILPTIFILVCLFTDLFSGLLRNFLLLYLGLWCIGFYLFTMILPKKQPDFLYTNRRTARDCRIPYLRRTSLKISKRSFFFLILGLYAVSPWILPNLNLIVILIASSIILVMYVTSRTTLKEQSTPAVLFLLMVSALPVWLPIGNVLLLSQIEAFRQQYLTFLQSYQGVLFSEDLAEIYAGLTLNEITIIPLVNISTLLVGAYFAPSLWDKFKSLQPWKPDEGGVSYNKKVHAALLLLYLSYGASSLFVLISYVMRNPIVPIESDIELVIVFIPTIVVGAIFTYYRCKKYVRIRRERLARSTKSVLDTIDNKFEVLIIENLDVTAYSIDLFLAEPRIVINEQLLEALDDNELAAVYFHEIYHIESRTISHQRIANIPVIGPMFFLAFINPKEVYLEEFRADEFAAKKVGKQAVISAIESSSEVTYDRVSSTDTSDIHGMSEFLEFITTVPIVGIYRPTRKQRIQNLREN